METLNLLNPVGHFARYAFLFYIAFFTIAVLLACKLPCVMVVFLFFLVVCLLSLAVVCCCYLLCVVVVVVVVIVVVDGGGGGRRSVKKQTLYTFQQMHFAWQAQHFEDA